MKIGDRVRLISMREIEEQAEKFDQVVYGESGRFLGRKLTLPDVRLGEIGTVLCGNDEYHYNVRFNHCTVICNDRMVEVISELAE